jgi:hypothetical protein
MAKKPPPTDDILSLYRGFEAARGRLMAVIDRKAATNKEFAKVARKLMKKRAEKK